MFVEPTITLITSGFSGYIAYIWLGTKSVSKRIQIGSIEPVNDQKIRIQVTMGVDYPVTKIIIIEQVDWPHGSWNGC